VEANRLTTEDTETAWYQVLEDLNTRTAESNGIRLKTHQSTKQPILRQFGLRSFAPPGG